MKEFLKGISKRYILVVILIISLIVIDQITKFYAVTNLQDGGKDLIQNVLSFSYVENTGGAFGFGYNNTFSFIVSNIVVLGLLIKFLVSQNERIDTKTLITISIVLAGGFSNLIDRIFRGYVVDFIKIFPGSTFPSINIADMCIVLGWVVLVYLIVMNLFKTRKEDDSKEIKEGEADKERV